MKYQTLGSMPNFTYAIRIAKADINTHLKFNLTFKWFKGQDICYQCLALQTIEYSFTYVIFFLAIWKFQAASSYQDIHYQLKLSHCKEWANAADRSVDYSSYILGIVDQPLIHLLTTACFFPLLSVSWGHDVPKERMELVHGTAGSKVCWPVFATGWM